MERKQSSHPMADPGVSDWKEITVILQSFSGDEIEIINPTLRRGLDS